jgi:hypothetical protein
MQVNTSFTEAYRTQGTELGRELEGFPEEEEAADKKHRDGSK